MGRYLRAQISALHVVFPQGPGTAAVGRKTRRFDFACHNRFFNRLFLLVFRMADFWTLSGRSGNGCASVFLAQPTRQHHRRNRDVHDSSSHLKNSVTTRSDLFVTLWQILPTQLPHSKLLTPSLLKIPFAILSRYSFLLSLHHFYMFYTIYTVKIFSCI